MNFELELELERIRKPIFQKLVFLDDSRMEFFGTRWRLMSEFVKFLSLSNRLELCSDQFSSRFHWAGGINKDPTVWLDGALPPPLSTISKIV
jgi:hypothetical protein